MFESK